MNIGEKIKVYRIANNLTQYQLAVKSEINEKYYGKIERNEASPTINTLEKIAKALNIDIKKLL